MKEQIDFDTFLEIEKKLDIKFGTIVEVEKMEKSNKMLKLQVNFGTETRTVMTNIGNRISSIECILNAQFPFIVNLKPSKIMGVESSAMIMIAEDSDGNLQPLSISNGSNLL